MLVFAVVTETSVKNLGLLVLQNSWAYLFYIWDTDSTQLERAKSVIK